MWGKRPGAKTRFRPRGNSALVWAKRMFFTKTRVSPAREHNSAPWVPARLILEGPWQHLWRRPCAKRNTPSMRNCDFQEKSGTAPDMAFLLLLEFWGRAWRGKWFWKWSLRDTIFCPWPRFFMRVPFWTSFSLRGHGESAPLSKRCDNYTTNNLRTRQS